MFEKVEEARQSFWNAIAQRERKAFMTAAAEFVEEELIPLLKTEEDDDTLAAIATLEKSARALREGREDDGGGAIMDMFVQWGKEAGEVPEEFDWRTPDILILDGGPPEETTTMRHVDGRGYVAHVHQTEVSE